MVGSPPPKVRFATRRHNSANRRNEKDVMTFQYLLLGHELNLAKYRELWGRMASCAPVGNRRSTACRASFERRFTNPPHVANLPHNWKTECASLLSSGL